MLEGRGVVSRWCLAKYLLAQLAANELMKPYNLKNHLDPPNACSGLLFVSVSIMLVWKAKK